MFYSRSNKMFFLFFVVVAAICLSALIKYLLQSQEPSTDTGKAESWRIGR